MSIRRLSMTASCCIAAVALLAASCSGSTTRTASEEPSVQRPPAPVQAARSPTPASAIAFEPQEPWSDLHLDVGATLDFDQPITQIESAAGYRPRASYDGPKDWSALVVDLLLSFDTRAPDAPPRSAPSPLAQLAEVQVFGADRSAPIAVFTGAQLRRERGTANGFQLDGRGPVVSTVERVRLPFAAHRALVRDAHPYAFVVVALDAQRRTMACAEIDGDEAASPIQPTARPQTGWAVAASDR